MGWFVVFDDDFVVVFSVFLMSLYTLFSVGGSPYMVKACDVYLCVSPYMVYLCVSPYMVKACDIYLCVSPYMVKACGIYSCRRSLCNRTPSSLDYGVIPPSLHSHFSLACFIPAPLLFLYWSSVVLSVLEYIFLLFNLLFLF